MKKLALGIDIGGTNTKFGFVDRDGNIYGESSSPTAGYPEFDDYLAMLIEQIEKSKNALDFDVDIVGVGIGAPNGNYYHGTIEDAPNLEWKGTVPFSEKMSGYYPKRPIILTNDANAAALGEMVYGNAKGLRDFILITLGTGLGSGIVSNGELVYGHDGKAGELGHVTVKRNGRICGCGKKGCLETYVSATGIVRTVYKLLADHSCDSVLRDVSFNNLSAKMITTAALEGDYIANEAFRYTAKVLGLKLADAVAHSSPKTIFLFGGLVHAGDILLEPVRRQMNANLMSIYKGNVDIQISGLQDKNAAVLGASSLVWQDLEK